MKNRHRNFAFYVETLVLTLFFLLALALLVRLFGVAQALGRTARQTTDAALVVQNVAAQLHAGEAPWGAAMDQAAARGEPQTAAAGFAADGTQQPAEQADYTATVVFTPQAYPAGTLLLAQATVTGPGGDVLAELETAHYRPAPLE